MYTVKQLSQLAGVSVRTLHYYDAIGLLKPATVRQNGYRHYDDAALFRLQQIRFYRELDLALPQIKALLAAPNFDLVTALRAHRQHLTAKMARLATLLGTVDATIAHLTGERTMSKKEIFTGFTAEKQQQYEAEAVQQWGATAKASIKLWNSYTAAQKEQIKQEGSAIYVGLAEYVAGDPAQPAVQALLGRWHEHLRYFYEPSREILRGLGDHYYDHPDFNATFTAIHPDLPLFLKKAIAHYVAGLTTGAA